MKYHKNVIIPAYVYRHYDLIDKAVKVIIGDVVRQIIYEHGTNIKIAIKKTKHVRFPSDEDSYIVNNGFVRGWYLTKEDYEQFTLYPPETIDQYLDENWFDYIIEFETYDEKKNNEKEN